MNTTMTAADLQAAIDRAKESGLGELTVSGAYEINAPIVLPSNFTLILEDAYLRMADGVMCQMFVSEHTLDPNGEIDRNISLIGRGSAVLDGGEYNGLSERNSGKDGMPYIYQNNMLLFAGVEGFRIENLKVMNQRWWALNFICCGDGVIRNIEFEASDLRRLPSGELVHGLLRAEYEGTLVKNADGIDLRLGCHDILIENISGFTEDDTVALTALPGGMEKRFGREGYQNSICRITIRHIRAAAFCTVVRLLNQGGAELHDILIEDVTDTAPTDTHLDRGIGALRVGDNHLYGTCHSTPEQTTGIVARNILSAGDRALHLAGALKDCSFTDIRTYTPVTALIVNEAVCDSVVIDP